MGRVLDFPERGLYVEPINELHVKKAIDTMKNTGRYLEHLSSLEASLRLSTNGYCRLDLADRAIVNIFS